MINYHIYKSPQLYHVQGPINLLNAMTQIFNVHFILSSHLRLYIAASVIQSRFLFKFCMSLSYMLGMHSLITLVMLEEE